MGTGKSARVNAPILFFARDREIADEACPGDIIGIPNHGVLRVGDTLTEGETDHASPASRTSRRKSCGACGSRTRLKAKQLKQALDDLAEEGVTQLFRPDDRRATTSSAWSASCSSRC